MQYQDQLCSALDNIKLKMLTTKLRYTVCPEHPDELASLLCLDIDCEKAGVICAQCQLLNHRLHRTQPITLAVKEILLDISQGPSLEAVLKIDELQIEFQGLLNRLGRDKSLVQPQANAFFSLIHQSIKRNQSLSKQILSCQEADSKFNSLIKLYKFNEKSQQSQGKSNFQLYLERLIARIHERLEDFQSEISEKKGVQEILKMFSPINQDTPRHFAFSKSNHHYSIAVSQDLLTATQNNNSSMNLAFIEPAIMRRGQLKSKKSIRFCINKHVSWLSIGVAYLNIAKAKAFNFSSGSHGHGAFMACFNGYTWHHSDPALNSGYSTFSYNQGDIVTVSVLPNNKLVFERSGSQPFDMYLDILPNQQLFFCVCLTSHEESVSILR